MADVRVYNPSPSPVIYGDGSTIGGLEHAIVNILAVRDLVRDGVLLMKDYEPNRVVEAEEVAVEVVEDSPEEVPEVIAEDTTEDTAEDSSTDDSLVVESEVPSEEVVLSEESLEPDAVEEESEDETTATISKTRRRKPSPEKE